MIKIQDILLEVGEGTAEPYKLELVKRDKSKFEDVWQKVPPELKGKVAEEDVQYLFTTDSKLHYLIDVDKTVITHQGRPIELKMNVAFGTMKKGSDEINYTRVTNKGDLYRIMATVLNAVRREIQLHNKDKRQPMKITKIAFYPSKKNKGDDRRERLYAAYVKKAMPNANVTSYDDGERVEVTNEKGF